MDFIDKGEWTVAIHYTTDKQAKKPKKTPKKAKAKKKQKMNDSFK